MTERDKAAEERARQEAAGRERAERKALEADIEAERRREQNDPKRK